MSNVRVKLARNNDACAPARASTRDGANLGRWSPKRRSSVKRIAFHMKEGFSSDPIRRVTLGKTYFVPVRTSLSLRGMSDNAKNGPSG